MEHEGTRTHTPQRRYAPGNKLSGRIPTDIINLNLLLELQLGGNQLGGPIPDMPLSLQIALNLSHNLFQGPVPISLSRLTSLEVLDLSYNRFSGQIPGFLTRMEGLTRLVLSNNQLSGVVPEFGGFVIVETDGNSNLIYPSPAAPPQVAKKRISIVLVVVCSVCFGITASICIQYFTLNCLYRTEVSWLTNDRLHKSQIKLSKAMAATCRPVNIMQSNKFYNYYKVMMPCSVYYCVKKIKMRNKLFSLHS
ncbi:hypothetical protein HAX54_039490 [Datura stramonium]|uniref:Uncharacterized protein n=1 Tax=Datura stramonium TaxID=4076 RepID=A0ABS8VNR7_DATST|nr:hypothetical protein [Datura stramonium]